MIEGIWDSFRVAIGKSMEKRNRRRRRDRHAISLRHEPLESRQLLSVNTISFNAATSQIVVRGTQDADQVTITSNGLGNVHVRASSLDGVVEADFLAASVTSVRFDGSDGNDRFENRTNLRSDLLGGAGDDVLIGGGADDRILGGLGDDQIYGGGGNDELRGEDGNDAIFGGDGNDEMTGGLGNDTMLGGAGNDFIVGSEGNDELRGEEGADRLLGQTGDDYLSGGGGDDELVGGEGNDTLFGGEGNDSLSGQEGDDFLDGLGGDDVLNGGIGNDQLQGGYGNDQLYGDFGDDWLYGEAGNDRLLGQGGRDYLMGGGGDDVIMGGDDDDRLLGNDGADRLSGQAGNDFLTGGDGNDDLAGGLGSDKMLGGAGDDFLDGGGGGDVMYGDEGNDRLLGQAGDDYLSGGVGNDYLLGAAGDDSLNGNEGDDELVGQDGADILEGAAGNDTLSGGAGDDRLRGGAGNDYLAGYDGNDELVGNEGDDELLGMEGDDLLHGGAGDDKLVGGGGNNLLVGGAGNDKLSGGAAKDVLIGGAGVDDLSGGWGEDLLIGATTSYDDNLKYLHTLLAAWRGAAPYATRIAIIEDELFANYLELQETVFDDGVADALFGGEGQDWFFLTGVMAVYDPNAGDGHDHDHGADHHATFIVDAIPEREGFDLIDSLDKTSDRLSTEILRTVIPHADDPVLQREHLSLFQLVRYDQVTHYAVASGAWSDPATWHNGVVPTNGARVLIPIGTHVEVNGMIAARIATIRVDGTLSFATAVNTELRVDTVIVAGTGAFEMGTAAQPIAASVKARLLITDNGAINRTADPFGIGRGLVSHGRVTIYGAEVTSSATLRTSPVAGATQLRFWVAPVGWKVGDTIVVAATTVGAEQNEVRTIRSVSGSLILLDKPLDFDHLPAATDLRVHVINTTRNAVIESESSVIERRGHTMFMHSRDVDVAFAGFYGLGRTNKLAPINDAVVDANWQLQAGTGTNQRARYPVHFHRNGMVNDGNPAVIRGSAVVDAPGWGLVNHSSYVDMVDNVAFDVVGAAFATEVGDEIGSFDRNVAIGTTGSGEVLESRKQIQDFGHQGDGFWFQGPGVSVTNNVSAGNQGSAFVYFNRGLIEGGVRQEFLAANLANPEIANGAAEVPVSIVPILKFENNIGYSSRIGLNAWYLLENATHDVRSVLANSTFWNNRDGIQLPYSRQTILDSIRVIHGPAISLGDGVGLNTVTRDIVYRNMTIIGYTRGIVLPRRGYSVVEGGVFDNFKDIMVLVGLSPNRSVLITGQAVSPSVHLSAVYRTSDGNISQLFTTDSVILDFGPFDNQRAYYDGQRADAVPFPTAMSGVPAEYVGLKAQELWDQFGLAIGGTLAPANAVESPLVLGGIGDPS